MESAALLDWINRFGLTAVFLIVMLEYACFPLPSEIVLPFAGAFASYRAVGFLPIYLLSVAAGVSGCLLCYGIGRFGGRAVLRAVSAHAPKSRKSLEASRQWFAKYGGISVLIGRVLPLCRTYISFFAGLAGQNPVQFIVYSAAGIAVWNAVLVGLGFQLGQNWTAVSAMAEKYSCILLPVVFIAGVVIVCGILRKIRTAEYPKKRGKL